MEFLKRLCAHALDIVFPRSAEVRLLEETAAEEYRGIMPRPEANPRSFAYSLFSYRHPLVRTLVWEIKYRSNRKLTTRTAELLHEMLLEEASDMELFGGTRPMLIPIPLSGEKLRKRGWNQSEELARKIYEFGNGAYDLELSALTKIRNTPAQTSLDRSGRQKNLAGCFAADARIVRGRSVILIDDVTTTGATLEEARRTLAQAGAKEVRAFTIAH